MKKFELTPQEAFDLWDEHILPHDLQARLAEFIMGLALPQDLPEPVRIEVWLKGFENHKARVSVPAALWVSGAWRDQYLREPDQPWRRL